MNRVHFLKEDVRKTIAAGEVIERPSSVVKELIENSIDAGASRIIIDIENGGKSLVKVADNGCGIYREDVPLVVQRYTTSKIETKTDLERITTMGFRGEALASISAVSTLEILSRHKDEDVGRMIKVIGGEIKEERDYQRQAGTTIAVRNLFFNFPSRRKFLHSSNAEFRSIKREVIPIGLAFPGISLELTHNGNNVLNLAPENLEERIVELFGRDFFDNMIPFEVSGNEINIYGFLQKPTVLPLKRNYLFVNKRNVWHSGVFKFIQDYYNLPVGDKPSFIIFIEIEPYLIDLNVHPQKKEVFFLDEHRIFSPLASAIEQSIGERGFYRVELSPVEESSLFGSTYNEKVWQIHNSYVVAETKNGLVLVDQHAAHERILYEQLQREASFPSQSLLFPIQVTFTSIEIEKLKEIKKILERYGFKFKILSGNTVIWEGIPAIIESITETDLRAIIEEISKKKVPGLDEILKSIACHSAIKQGDVLSTEEMVNLIEQLFSTEHPYTCPHGRPTLIDISINELEKRFRRR